MKKEIVIEIIKHFLLHHSDILYTVHVQYVNHAITTEIDVLSDVK